VLAVVSLLGQCCTSLPLRYLVVLVHGGCELVFLMCEAGQW